MTFPENPISISSKIIRPSFVEFGLGMPETLRPKQNIVDQPPFDTLSSIIKLPNDFFVGNDPLAGLGAFVRCVAFQHNDWIWASNTNPVKHLMPFVNRTYRKTSIEIYHMRATEFFDSFAYLYHYLREFWKDQGPLFEINGYPKPKLSIKTPIAFYTFAKYQDMKRGPKTAGIENEITGFETPNTLEVKLSRMSQTGSNKTYRVLRTYTGNNG